MILSFCVAGISLGLGCFFVGKAPTNVGTRFERLFIAFALGYGLLAYFIYLAGITIGFNKPIVFCVFAVATIFSGVGFFQFFKHGEQSALNSLKKIIQTREEAFMVLWVGGFVFLLVLGAFLPPTAHDALCYHLNIPKRWVQDGTIGYYPYLVNSLFPFLIQVYYGIGVLFQVDYAAHFFHLFCLLGTVVGVFTLACRLGNSWAAWAAALILISAPGVFNQANLPLNDIALMFFSFAMLYAVFLAVENDFSPRLIIVAGILGGFALGIKYFAALHILATAVAALFFSVQNKVRPLRIFQSVILFSVFACLFGGVWYIRSWMLEGNPVYPYFANVFGVSSDIGYDFEKQGYGKGLLDLILIPWRVVMFPQSFGGTWSQIGLIYLVFLPFVFLRASSSKATFWKSALLVYFLGWFFIVQNLRFSYFILPIWAVLIALKAWSFRWVLYLLIALNTAFAVYHSKEALVYSVKQEKREDYLSRTDSTYEMVQKINQIVPAGEKIFVEDLVRLYYLNAQSIRANEFFNRHRTDWQNPQLVDQILAADAQWILTRRETLKPLERLDPLKRAIAVGEDYVLLNLRNFNP